MENTQFVTIFLNHGVLTASFSDEVHHDDKKRVILTLCQHVNMFSPKIVHVTFEHNSLPKTIEWFREFGFVQGYKDKDYYTLKIDPEVLVKKYVGGFLTVSYHDKEPTQVVWKAKL